MESSSLQSHGPFLKTDAIVIGVHPVSEADLGLLVFTEDYGLLKLRVRGIRKTKKRTRLEFEIGSVAEFEFYNRPKVEWKNIKNSKFLFAADEARKAYTGLFVLSYFCSLIRRSCPEGQIEPAIYKLLYGVLNYLKDNKFHFLLLLFFKARLLNTLGVLPDFFHCAECETGLTDFAWPEPYENVLCPSCWDPPLNRIYSDFLQSSVRLKFGVVFDRFSGHEELKHLDRALNSILHNNVRYEDVDDLFYKNVNL